MKKSDEIKEAVNHLHQRGSGDWQSLFRQVTKATSAIEYNLPQLVALIQGQRVKNMFLEWGRGTGKSTYIGRRIVDIVGQMPRSNSLIIGSTYKATLTRTLPSTIASLEMHGYYQNLHYFVGRFAPRSWNWPTAYQPPASGYDKSITFWNGTHFALISHDVADDGIGLNTDAHIGDEAAHLNSERLDQNTSPTLRGSNVRAFRDAPTFCSTLMVSSTPTTQEGKWFLKAEQKAREMPDKWSFIMANAKDNLANLAPDWLERQRELAIHDWLFDAEYLNIRPDRVRGGFYPNLDVKVHGYNAYNYSYYTKLGVLDSSLGDADIDPNRELVLGIDWGAVINSAVVFQVYPSELRCLKDFFVLSDRKETQDDLFARIATYYASHPTKRIKMFYDNTGNLRTGNTSVTRAQQAKQQLERLGWQVQLLTRGDTNPRHERKFMIWQRMLIGSDPKYPRFRINLSNCRDLIISMQNAKSKEGRTVSIQKDKSSEGKAGTIDRQHATDLSDAADTVVFGLYNATLSNLPTSMPNDVISHR